MTQSHDLENIFTYHAPTDAQKVTYELIRNEAKNLAGTILQECPQSRERSLAMTKVEEAVMWANSAIARNKKPQQDNG